MERAEIAFLKEIVPRASRTRRGPRGLFVMAGLLLLAGPVLAAASAEWTSISNTASTGFAGYAPTTSVLTAGANAGRVLAVGGYNSSTCVTAAQLFDPNSNTWSATGPLKLGRSFHAAADFGDGSGRVFVAGGFTTNTYGQWVTQKTTEVYNPSNGTFGYTTRYETRIVKNKPTQVAVQVSMGTARELFTATLMPKSAGGNGKILLTGGMYAGRNIVRSVELFDPAAMTITYTGSMLTPYGRFEHDAVYIPPDVQGVTGDQGTVLVVGGKDRNPNTNVWTTLGTAELYDVSRGTFQSIPMLHARSRPRVVWIPSVPRFSDPTQKGMALIVGGKYEGPEGNKDVLKCEWFDPTWKQFFEGPSLKTGRMAHTLTSLGDGTSFLAAGGWCEAQRRSTDTAERFLLNPSELAPLRGEFVETSTMVNPRQDHDAVTLPGGRVLVVGGKPNNGGDTYLNRQSEVYTLPRPTSLTQPL